MNRLKTAKKGDERTLMIEDISAYPLISNVLKMADVILEQSLNNCRVDLSSGLYHGEVRADDEARGGGSQRHHLHRRHCLPGRQVRICCKLQF